MKRVVGSTLIVLIITFFIPFAQARDVNPEKEWEFRLAPLYLWAVSINGEGRKGPITSPIEADFNDIFSNLEAVFTLHFEAWWKQRWGVLAEINYVDLGDDKTIPGGVRTDVGITSVISELGGFYRFDLDGPHIIEPLFGFRYTSLQNEVDVQGIRVLDEDEGWLDPFFGARYMWNFAEKWVSSFRGDIGGFGIGSEFTWQTFAAVDFKPWKHVSIFGGYRALGQDYETGNRFNKFEYDVIYHGPLLGVMVHF
jgi:hypothetical protein